MTIGQMSLFYTRCTGILFFLLLLLAFMGIVYSVNTKQYNYCKIYSIVMLVCLIFVGCFEGVINESWYIYEIPVWIIYFKRIPIGLMALICISSIIVLIVLSMGIKKSMSTMLTPRSLEEGMAKLPDGVYFESSDGIPLLINRKMQEIINELFVTHAYGNRLGERLLRAYGLTEKKDHDNKDTALYEIREGCRLWRSEAGSFACLNDGSVWDIHYREIPVKRGRKDTVVHEILAYDITKRYEKHAELEERNAHLNAINERLREYSSNLDSITRQKEMLNAKIRLHDDVGRCLLALKAYLSAESVETEGKNGSNIHDHETEYSEGDEQNKSYIRDRHQLEELWKSTIAVLNNEALREPDVDRMGSIRKAADAVNVRLDINGEIRQDNEELVSAAIHECITNTVKHADGDRINVDINYNENEMSVEITNNGRPPYGEISETGGLANLRRMVELKGGVMVIQSTPVFKMIITKKLEIRQNGECYE